MTARRVPIDKLEVMVRLHRLATPAREIARQLAMGPNTERRYRLALRTAGLLDGPSDALPSAASLAEAVDAHVPKRRAPQQISSIEAWSARIAALLAEGLGPRAIHLRMRREEETFHGSLSAVKRLCRRLR